MKGRPGLRSTSINIKEEGIQYIPTLAEQRMQYTVLDCIQIILERSFCVALGASNRRMELEMIAITAAARDSAAS
ncbi:hypothetical protein EVAR_23013_1 [Eumeta japonica]|uniref:Uncharacterized protein n=1 Tax=Eumeta variegata TaxID=151549 RepID=A0A4C1UQ30_EUMVA|nr:hypothetical protein EVAR_23013_1 [Eumeta japonica]